MGNFGLYNERAGNLTIVTANPGNVDNIKRQMTLIIRAMVSNPPAHGARIVDTVMGNPELYQEWRECIRVMSARIISMRASLRQNLKNLELPETGATSQHRSECSPTRVSPRKCVSSSNRRNICIFSSRAGSVCVG